MFYRMDHCHITRSCGISHWTYIHRHSIDADFLLLGMQIGKQSGRCLIATFCETEDIFPLNLRRRGKWRELSMVKGRNEGKALSENLHQCDPPARAFDTELLSTWRFVQHPTPLTCEHLLVGAIALLMRQKSI